MCKVAPSVGQLERGPWVPMIEAINWLTSACTHLKLVLVQTAPYHQPLYFQHKGKLFFSSSHIIF